MTNLDWRISIQLESLEESARTGTISVRDCELTKNLIKELRGVQCGCGQPFPTHLANLGLTRHICGCERAYKVVDGKFILDGTETNPFTRKPHGS